jgi:hypothetical protein
VELQADWDRLDIAAYRVSIVRSVRVRARSVAIIGAVVFGCGLFASFPPFVAIGLVLVASGLGNLVRPSVTGVLVEGATTILTGLFTLSLPLWSAAVHASPERALVGAVPQIVWGARRLAVWWTARTVVNDPPAIARLEQVVRDLARRDLRTDPSVVELRTGRIRRVRNRLGMESEGVVALFDGSIVRLDRRADVWIESIGTTALGRASRVKVRMGALELEGEMSPSHVERFERWKLAPEARASAA